VIHPGDAEGQPGDIELHFKTVDGYLGAVEAHLGAWRLTLEPWNLILNPCGSSLSLRRSTWSNLELLIMVTKDSLRFTQEQWRFALEQ
jgi:hypothetical protein